MVEQLLTAARSQNPAVYKDLMSEMADRITRRIAGQTLTSHGSDQGKGTQALGLVHEQTKYQKMSAIAKTLECVVNDQLVKPLVLWNFGPNALMPKWSIDLENEENLKDRIGIDQTAQGMGVPISPSYMREKYNLPDIKAERKRSRPRLQPPTRP
jgi:phage gp29-like protein